MQDECQRGEEDGTRGEEDGTREEVWKAERVARQDRKEPEGGVARRAAHARSERALPMAPTSSRGGLLPHAVPTAQASMLASPAKMEGTWNRQEAAGSCSAGAGSLVPGAGGGSGAAACKQPSASEEPTLEALCEMAAGESSSDDE